MTGGIAPGVELAGGRFLIEELLGTGGMAAVYRAYDSVLGRTVAIKTMGAGPAADPTGRERFRREARAAAALSHAHVVAVHDVLEEEIAGARIPYLVMEYVRGRPLSRLVPSRPGGLPLAEVLRFAAEILDALAASHACGLVHRDVKPANVMVTEDGSVKVMDFGIARALDGQATALTGTGLVVGTPHYMAPEQFDPGRGIDTRCDLYAVGVILYQLLTGTVPFDADSAFMIGYLHVTAEPPALTAQVPSEVRALVNRALAKKPDDRFPDAQSMRAQILGAGDGAVAAGVAGAGAGAGYVATAVDRRAPGAPFPPDPAGPGRTADLADAATAPLAGVPARPDPGPPATTPAQALRQAPAPERALVPVGAEDTAHWLKRGLGHPLLWLLAFVPLLVCGVFLDRFTLLVANRLVFPGDFPSFEFRDPHGMIPGWVSDDWWRLPLNVVLLCALGPLLYFRGRLGGTGALPVRAWTAAVGAFWLSVCAAWALNIASFTIIDNVVSPSLNRDFPYEISSVVRVMGFHPASARLLVTVACACAAPVVLGRTVLRIRRAWTVQPLGHTPPDHGPATARPSEGNGDMNGRDEPRQLGELRSSYLPEPQRWVGLGVAGGVIAVIGVPLVIAVAAEGKLWGVLFLLIVIALYGWMLSDKVKSARRAVNARLDLFERGAVVTTAEGAQYSFAWDSTRVQQSVIHLRKNGTVETSHVYGLIREDGTAVVIGDAVTRMSSLGPEASTVVLGANFADPQEWGPAVQHAVTQARLPVDAHAVAQGRRLVHGPLAISREAIEYRGETVPWNRVDDLRVVNGRFRARVDGGRGLWMDVPVSAVPNFPVVNALAGQLHSASR